MNRRICVLGAGVIGLSSAIRIQDEIPDVLVTLIADKFSPDTTSDGSAGFWEPHLLNEGQTGLIMKWGKETFNHMVHLSKTKLAAKLGANLVSGYRFETEPLNPPWRDLVYCFRELSDAEMKLNPGSKYGYFYTSVMIDVTPYLSWLLQRFKSNGGKVEKRQIHNIPELYDDFDVIVNCTGLGSRHLLQDDKMTPIRGQVIKVRAPWLKHFVLDDLNLYILPGVNAATLGGTGQTGDWNTEVYKDDKDRIWQGCLKLIPSLQDAEVIKDWVGLRPQRTAIRIEMERCHKGSRQIALVHNYGHSGSGVTLHWGCAGYTVQLVKDGIKMLSAKSHL